MTFAVPRPDSDRPEPATVQVAEANAALRALARQRPSTRTHSWIPVPDDRVEWSSAEGVWKPAVVERVTISRADTVARIVLDENGRLLVAGLEHLRPSPTAPATHAAEENPRVNDTSTSLVDAVAAAAPTLTKREARDATAALLRKLSEFMDEDESDEGWPEADDLLMLADDIEARA